MFSRCGRLLEIAGQPSRAIGQRSERRLDAPAQRERLEPFCIPLSGRDLDVEVVGCCGLRHPRTDVDSIDLDPLQDEAERAGQHMALDAFYRLVAVVTARPGLRA